MIKKFLTQLLLKWYVKESREIMKIDAKEEMDLYLFRNMDDVDKLIRALLTSQTVRYFDAGSELERNIIKGSAFILKIMKDCHSFSKKIKSIDDEDERLKEWIRFRGKNRTS